MKISIAFNWPTGKDSARVTVGGNSLPDSAFEFRVGVIRESEKDKIYWAKPGWASSEGRDDITIDVARSDKAVVECRVRNGKSIVRNVWDVEEEWPANVSGDTLTVREWYFGRDVAEDKQQYCENIYEELKKVDSRVNVTFKAQSLKGGRYKLNPPIFIPDMHRRTALLEILSTECGDFLETLSPSERHDIKTKYK